MQKGQIALIAILASRIIPFETANAKIVINSTGKHLLLRQEIGGDNE